MSVDIVMGAAFGDECKGTLAKWLSRQKHYGVCIGPMGHQSAHAYYRNGQKLEGHHISAGWENSDVCYIPASAVINPDILLTEYNLCKSFKPYIRMAIHPLATVTYGSMESEEYIKQGSMGFGITEARCNKLMRKAILARDVDILSDFIIGPDAAINLLITSNNILIESGQGYGLSQNSKYYPYVSSTINTPYGILANAGIPYNVSTVEVYLIMRPYLTRTPLPEGGSNGPLADECSAYDLSIEPQIETWGQYKGREMRYAELDYSLIKSAIKECRPQYLVLSWADWWFNKHGEQSIKTIEDGIDDEFDLLGCSLTDFAVRNDYLNRKE